MKSELESNYSPKRLLRRLRGLRQVGDGRWQAMCPAHDDRHPSLSIKRADSGAILLRRHAGCSAEEICKAINLSVRDLFPRSEGKAGGKVRADKTTATPQQWSESAGITLKAYAKAKRLNIGFLKAIGLEDFDSFKFPAIRIPYRDLAGSQSAVRFRISLSGSEKFRWRKHSKISLYGLDRLDQAKTVGWVILVEGESDCHTLWQHDFPAIGIAGASNWNEERDAKYLDAIPLIYVVIEPDRGGEQVLKWLTNSKIRDRVRLVTLKYKDVSAMHIASRTRFYRRLRKAMKSAVRWAKREEVESRIRGEQAYAKCRSLAESSSILRQFQKHSIRCGVVGEKRATRLLFLVMVSRLLDKPVSVAVKCESSAGKSYLVGATLKFFPDRNYYAITAMSERALAYSSMPLKHRMLVIYEAEGIAGDFASYLVRSLLSEQRVRYETVVRTPAGPESKLIEREGPTGLITTTTLRNLHPENETRMLSLSIDNSPEQTRKILKQLAEGTPENISMEIWHALQDWLETANHRVQIPYAAVLAQSIPPIMLRLRRDFTALLSIIRSHAILHQATRSINDSGEIVATLADYKVARKLTADLFTQGVRNRIPQTVHETVVAVSSLLSKYKYGVPLRALAKKLNLNKSNASRRSDAAIKSGFLRNREQGRGNPARLILGSSIPEDSNLLPTVSKLEERVAALRRKHRSQHSPHKKEQKKKRRI